MKVCGGLFLLLSVNRHNKNKGYFNTIDILRKDKWLLRKHHFSYGIKTYNEDDSNLGHDRYDFSPSKNYINFDKTWFELTDGLDSFHTRILYMRYVEKRTVPEIMGIMKISKHAVNKIIYEARKMLCELHRISSENLKGAWASKGHRSK